MLQPFLTPDMTSRQDMLDLLRKQGFSPYGQPGGQIGPPTQEQAALIGSDPTTAAANQQQVNAQFNPSITTASGKTLSLNLGAQPQPAQARAAAVSQKAKGSGLEEESTAKNDAKQETSGQIKSNELQTLSPDQIMSMVDTYKQFPEFQQQEAGINQLQNMLSMQAARPYQMDFRPLAALGDAWQTRGRGNVAGAMSPVETPDERNQRIMMFMQKLQQDKRDMLNGIVNMIGKTKGGTLEQVLASKLVNDQSNGSKNTAVDPNKMVPHGSVGLPLQQAKAGDQYIKDQFGKDDVRAEKLAEIASMLTEENPTTDARISQIMASADVGGRPNIVEVQNDTGSKAATAKIMQAWDTLATGKITKENRADMLKHIQTLAEYHARHRAKMVERTKGVLATPKYGWTQDDIDKRFTPEYTNAYQRASSTAAGWKPKGVGIGNPQGGIGGGAPAAQPSPAPTGGGAPPVDADLSKMTPEQLQLYIKTHGGQ